MEDKYVGSILKIHIRFQGSLASSEVLIGAKLRLYCIPATTVDDELFSGRREHLNQFKSKRLGPATNLLIHGAVVTYR